MGYYDRFMPTVAYDFYDLPHNGVTLRGPLPDFDKPFVAVWGSSEIFGKYVEQDLCHHMSQQMEHQVVNFGIMNAGVDVMAWRHLFGYWSRRAQMNIVQTLPARHRNNAYYKVHPIRNDRLISVSNDLKRMFPEVNFLEMYFVGHLWEALTQTCPERARVVSQTIDDEGQRHFAQMIQEAPPRTIALHIDGPSYHRSTCPLIEHLTYTPSREVLLKGQLGMVFHEFERAAACRSLSAVAHAELARYLVDTVAL